MDKHQATALIQTGRNAVDYTRGVLASMGHYDLAVEIGTLAAARKIAEKEFLEADSRGNWLDDEPATPEYIRARACLDDVVARQDLAWAKIEAMADEARELLGQMDPMGMGQSA